MATKVYISPLPGAEINKNIYGQFAEHLGRCIYGGVYVGEDSPIPNVKGMRTDVVEALKKIQVPLLRWPGGCFADEYHWRDGIGPKENRKRMVNTNWGGVVEDNSFGTHEFMELCRQIGCEPYFSGNVGSGDVREMAEWVEYLNSEGDSTVVRERWQNGQKEAFNVRYLGIGNEPYGCGGNLTAENYADQYRRFQTFCRNYGKNTLYKVACGGDEDWTETVLKIAAPYMDAISVHAYVHLHSFEDKGSATDFDESDYYLTLRRAYDMDYTIRSRLAILDRLDPAHRIGLAVDEWGTWHECEPGTNPGFLYQQNTMRDAVITAVICNIFNSHADRVVMANIAQMVNVLQAMVLTEGEKMILTPTYHVFDMYRGHMGGRLLPLQVDCGKAGDVQQISASASRKENVITLTLANISCTDGETVEVALEGKIHSMEGQILHGDMHDMNTFEEKDRVQPRPFQDVQVTEKGIRVSLPPCAVVSLSLHL